LLFLAHRHGLRVELFNGWLVTDKHGNQQPCATFQETTATVKMLIAEARELV
jgi:hypothetical protein